MTTPTPSTSKTSSPRNAAKRVRKMTDKQQAFCNEYLIDLNATQAAIRAGYSAKTARQVAQVLLSNVNVQSSIHDAKQARVQRTQITSDDVLRDIKRVKDCAMTSKLDKDGADGMVDMSAALKALELLGKHLVMFTDKREITGADGGAILARIELGFVKP